jgi:hypothetical protein
MALKHKLLGNCIMCGRVVCAQEGYGVCLFCGDYRYGVMGYNAEALQVRKGP